MNFDDDVVPLNKQSVDINVRITVDDLRKPYPIKRSEFSDDEISYEKIKTKLTVSQLSYLFRVLIDLEVFKQRTKSDVLKFISDNFQTSNAEEISLNSLRSKYYTVDDSTRDAVKDVLIRMLKKIEKG